VLLSVNHIWRDTRLRLPRRQLLYLAKRSLDPESLMNIHVCVLRAQCNGCDRHGGAGCGVMDVTDVELIVERSVAKIATPLSFTAVTHPNIRKNINSFVFSYGDGSRLHTSFDASATHAYRKHGM